MTWTISSEWTKGSREASY